MLAMLSSRLDTAHAELLLAVAEALDDRAHLPALDTFDAWAAAPVAPLEAPWPEE